jgi:hypothetical protein
MAGPHISALFRARGPSAVFLEVSKIVIDAVDGHSRRGLAHIGEEVFEDQPAITDGDSSPTVVFESLVLGIEASLDDGRPPTIDRRSFASRTMTVFTQAIAQFVSMATAAAGCVSAFQSSDSCNYVASAVAFAKPLRSLFFVHVRKASDYEATEAQSGKILENWHPVILSYSVRQ